VVPRPASPLRSTSSPGCRRGFRPRWSPRTLEPSASGRTMMRQAGVPGSSTSPETSGSSRDPQLPWGFRCIGRRSGAFRCSTPPSTGMLGRAGSFRGLPLRPPAAVARSVRPFHVTGLSKSHLLGQQSRYYDRLHFLIKNLDLQPMAFRFCLLQQNLPALLSSCLATGLPGVKCPSGPDVISRRIWISFRESQAEALSFLLVCK
jgi:hypothetical protein